MSKDDLIFILSATLFTFVAGVFIITMRQNETNNLNASMHALANAYQTKHPEEKLTKIDGGVKDISLPSNIKHIVYVAEGGTKTVSTDVTDTMDVSKVVVRQDDDRYVYIFSKEK